MKEKYPSYRDVDKLKMSQIQWMIDNNAILTGIKPRRGGKVYQITKPDGTTELVQNPKY